MSILLVVLGAAVGAPTRFLVDRAVQARHDSVFPWGTFSVNIGGSFVLGTLLGLPVGPAVTLLVGVGFCGALTTFSTFGYETWRLIVDGARFYALANVVASTIAGLGAGFLGYALAEAFTR